MNISAHHGYANKQNELKYINQLIEEHPEIEMYEIDFIYEKGQYISSHDYNKDNIAKGSNLIDWLELIVGKNKIIWLDIKDSLLSLISEHASKTNVSELFKLLREQKQKFKGLEKNVMISSQFEHIRKQILYENNNEFTIIHDLPYLPAYVAQYVTIPCMDFILDYFVQEKIQCETNNIIDDQIIGLDVSFFDTNDNLVEFINKIPATTIIIYSLELNSGINLNLPDKKIIYQYNYYL
jgi:hypothetical protein